MLKPPSSSASSARSASFGLTMRSRSWSVSGPPRAQAASPPARRNGTSASRSAAAAFFRLGAIVELRPRTACYPRRAANAPREESAHVIDPVAAAGDIHAGGPGDERLGGVFARRRTRGRPRPPRGRPDAARRARTRRRASRRPAGDETPVFAVLGNHDWHENRWDEVVEALEEAGIRVLDGSRRGRRGREPSVGIAGAKGFVGGFPDSALPDFGEPSLRRVYAETTEEVEALERGARGDRGCAVRIVLLHYAPTTRRSRASRRGSGRSSARTASPARSRSTAPTSSSTAMPTRARSRARSARSRSTTSPSRDRQDFWIFELDLRRAAPRSARRRRSRPRAREDQDDQAGSERPCHVQTRVVVD